MASKIWKWINDRMPVSKILQLGLDEEIPGGASFFFTLGSATLFIFILQICQKLFGKFNLRMNQRMLKDHLHFHIIIKEKV